MNNNNQSENNFILGVDRMRRNVNDFMVALPIILGIFFPIIVAPIIIVLCDVSVVVGIALILLPPLLMFIFCKARVSFIIKRFMKVDNVEDKVELVDIPSTELDNFDKDKSIVIDYSDYMVKVLYNWLYSIDAIKGDKLKMYKVFWDNYVIPEIVICEEDLITDGKNADILAKELFHCTHLSDREGRMTVNAKYCERMKRNQQ